MGMVSNQTNHVHFEAITPLLLLELLLELVTEEEEVVVVTLLLVVVFMCLALRLFSTLVLLFDCFDNDVDFAVMVHFLRSTLVLVLVLLVLFTCEEEEPSRLHVRMGAVCVVMLLDVVTLASTIVGPDPCPCLDPDFVVMDAEGASPHGFILLLLKVGYDDTCCSACPESSCCQGLMLLLAGVTKEEESTSLSFPFKVASFARNLSALAAQIRRSSAFMVVMVASEGAICSID